MRIPMKRMCAGAVCVAAVLLPAAPASAATPTWTKVGSYQPPIVRYGHAMAPDRTGRAIIFGGLTTGTLGPEADTWRFNGSRWERLQPAASPSEREFAAIAYDPVRKETVLFGGIGPAGVLGDTWAWDGDTWAQRASTQAPLPRYLSRMAWDPASKRLILFGGLGPDGLANSALADTWSWDGTSWTLETPLLSPTPRYGFGFADGDVTSKPVLFGGTPGDPQGVAYHGDTWTWDGAVRTWTLAATTGPTGRANPAMAYDAARGRTILFGGGSKAPSNPLGAIDMLTDTWSWDGTAWTQLSPPRSPWYKGRFWAGLAFDTVDERLHMFGGYSCTAGLEGFGGCLGGYSNDTWAFDGTTWIQEDLTAPNEMQKPMFARDPVEGAVAFGGQFEYGNYSQQTWRWDGSEWDYLEPAHAPLPRGMAAMTYVPLTDTTLLFGGNIDTLGLPGPREMGDTKINDTWIWDGVDWTELHPETSPPPRSEAMIAYDDSRDEVVLFGGSGSGDAKNDTWVWDGSAWIEKHPENIPPARIAGSMAYDPVRGEVVLFGGMMSNNSGYLDDTWVWNGDDWIEILTPPGGSPPMRAFGGMGWDPTTDSIVYFGGCSTCYANPTYDETWSWNGTFWSQVSTAVQPERMTSFAVLSGDEDHALMLFGGRRAVLTPEGSLAAYPEGTNNVNDVWEFHG